jgi:hypothetical protein
MTQQTSQFTVRLSATGGEQLVRILRNAGDAGEQMAQRILRSAQTTGPALETQRAQIDRVRVAMERTQAAAAGGIGGSGFNRGLTQTSVLLAQFSAQITGGSSQLAQFAQQATRLTGALSGGFAGLAVSLAAVAAQYLFATRASETQADADQRLREGGEALNAVLLTRAERARRAAGETLNLATQTARATVETEKQAIATARNLRAQLESVRVAFQVDPGAVGAFAQSLSLAGLDPTTIGPLIEEQERNFETASARLAQAQAQLAEVERTGLRNLIAETTAPAAARSAATRSNGEPERVLAGLRREQEQLTQQAEALARANRTVDEVYEEQIENINRMLPRLVELEGVERANEIAARASVEAYNERARALERGAERASGAARELGFAFSSAFEDAIIKGQRLSSVVNGLATDIARVILRRSVTDPLANAASGIISGINFGGLFSGIFGGGAATSANGVPFSAVPNANGNVFAGGSVIPFARGGIVNGPTMFPIAGGRTGLMGEAGPEAIMPLARDSAGRLGVRGGGPNITTQIVVDARGADPGAEARLRAVAGEIVKASTAATLDAVRRGGSARAIVRGA